MTTTSSSAALRDLLDQPNPHGITAAAHAARAERFGLRTTVSAVAHFDPEGAAAHCRVTGELAPEGGFARTLVELPDAATEILVKAPGGAALGDLARNLPAMPRGEGFAATVQLGVADDWIKAAADEFAIAREHGVRTISDAVDPQIHPALGATEEWTRFWKTAAESGLQGHAVVLYGPSHGLDSVFEQLAAIAAVQRETDVFLSVAPCIYSSAGFGGPGDHLLTQASLDIRVLAACRLFDTGVDHISLRYERSDLKSAHTALACGVDDLIGHLHLRPRDRKGDVEAKDLSVDEVRRWLAEAGFDPCLRNGAFDTIALEEGSA